MHALLCIVQEQQAWGKTYTQHTYNWKRIYVRVQTAVERVSDASALAELSRVQIHDENTKTELDLREMRDEYDFTDDAARFKFVP